MIVQPLKTTTKTLIFSMLIHGVPVRILSLLPAKYYHISFFFFFHFAVLRKLANLINAFLVYRKVQIWHKMQSLLKSWWFTYWTRFSGPAGLQSVVHGRWLYLRSSFECTFIKVEQVSLAEKFSAPLALRGIHQQGDFHFPTQVVHKAKDHWVSYVSSPRFILLSSSELVA